MENDSATTYLETTVIGSVRNRITFCSHDALDYKSPHECFIGFARRSKLDPISPVCGKQTGVIKLPEWLRVGEVAYARRQVRRSKSDPLVDLVTIMEIVSSHVVRVCCSETGRVSTMSTRHLSRAPQPSQADEDETKFEDIIEEETTSETVSETASQSTSAHDLTAPFNKSPLTVTRPRRQCAAPKYLQDYDIDS